MARTGIVVVLLIAGLVAGCRPPGSNLPPLPEMPAIARHVSLATPSGPGACEEAERRIEDQAVISMRVQMEDWRRYSSRDSGMGPPGGGGGGGGVDAGAAPGGPGPGSFSTTNLQTSTVDEADVMKNDGTRIFALSGTELALVQSWPATQLRTRASLQLGQLQRELLLVSPDRLVVFSDGSITRATFVDISNLSNPRIAGEIDLPGRYLTARRVGTAIRVVLRGTISLPAGVRVAFIPTDDASWAAQEAENEAIIRAQPLSHWLPDATTRNAGGQARQSPHACDQVSASSAPVALGLTTVATLDASDPDQVDRWSMLGEADTVYSSQSALYLASRHWWWWWEPGQITATYVHKFDISTPATAVHVASGVFGGTMPDSFGLDELEGRLRVATNVYELQDGAVRWSNRVIVLEPSGRELVEVGRTADFATGEQMKSARFLGKRAFVVTFRQVDPLFTLDMSDPTAPRVLGELTVPGFSTYLHPVGDAQLVAVGTGPSAGSQVSLFDVSDLANPRLVDVIPLGYGISEAQRDHRAFTWLPERKLFAVPYDEWPWSGAGYGRRVELKVFQVGTGLTALGTLSLTDAMPSEGYWPYYYSSPGYRRGILTDQDAYAVSESVVRVARLSDLSTPIATAITGSATGGGGGGYPPGTDGGTPDAG